MNDLIKKIPQSLRPETTYGDYALRGFLVCFFAVRGIFLALACVIVSPLALIGWIYERMQYSPEKYLKQRHRDNDDGYSVPHS
jgi:hypothetical protein